MKIHGVRLLVVLLLNVAGWANRRLPVSLSTYNAAVLEICNELETMRLPEFTSSLKKLGVSFDWPKLGLPLRHVEAPSSRSIASATDAGVPVVAGYETRQAPLYPLRVFSWMPLRSTTVLPGARDLRFDTRQATWCSMGAPTSWQLIPLARVSTSSFEPDGSRNRALRA